MTLPESWLPLRNERGRPAFGPVPGHRNRLALACENP